MSSSQFLPDGKWFGKAPEKSNFAQTCNLLSQYLKDRGSLRDLNLGTIGRTEASRLTTTTIDLLPNMERSDQTSTLQVKSMDHLFPPYADVGSSNTIEDTTINASSSKPATMETKTAQMTILYAGQVLVFDDFPTDKAREIMLLAREGCSPNSTRFFATSGRDKIKSGGSVASGSNTLPNSTTGFFTTSGTEKIKPGGSVASAVGTLPNSGSYSVQECLQPQPKATTTDIPFARRASLHRFFDKRKDRATARAPYQAHSLPTSSSSPSTPNQEEHLELKL